MPSPRPGPVPSPRYAPPYTPSRRHGRGKLTIQDTPVNDIVADIKARTGAFYFHAGSDHVLRAISTEFEVLESAPLTERQVADYNAGLGQTFAKRDDSVVDERELLETLEAKMRRESAEEIFKVEARQTCSGPSCDRRHCPSSVCRSPGLEAQHGLNAPGFLSPGLKNTESTDSLRSPIVRLPLLRRPIRGLLVCMIERLSLS